MTLGALGGAIKPATRDELLELARTSPVTNVVMVGRVLAVSEPVIREMARNGELEKMGVRVLRLGAQYRVPVADILRVLGVDPETGTAGPAPPDPADITPPTTLAKGRCDPHDTPAA